MKLRNKKTGEIRDGRIEVVFQNNDKFPNPLERHTVESIDELNEEWEELKDAVKKAYEKGYHDGFNSACDTIMVANHDAMFDLIVSLKNSVKKSEFIAVDEYEDEDNGE